ncbi:MAG: cytochrome b/b6 domain-containing protein [Desulfobacterales bacterium]
MENGTRWTEQPNLVPVWDLPTRLFHWLLAALVAAAFATAKAGGNAMIYHEWCGSAVLALLVFRAVWGIIGSGPSRFASFLVGPTAVLRYAMTLFYRDAGRHLSHNPLGGWSVAAMLLVLFIQAGTGLFANDDIATTGPLYAWVGKALSDRLTVLHLINQNAIVALVALHIAAVLFHLVYKRENLITPMITGLKEWRGEIPACVFQKPLWLAALAAAVSAGAVYWLVG